MGMAGITARCSDSPAILLVSNLNTCVAQLFSQETGECTLACHKVYVKLLIFYFFARNYFHQVSFGRFITTKRKKNTCVIDLCCFIILTYSMRLKKTVHPRHENTFHMTKMMKFRTTLQIVAKSVTSPHRHHYYLALRSRGDTLQGYDNK